MARGGKRPGAGREAGSTAAIRRVSAEAILAEHDPQKAWNRFLNSENDKIALDAWKFLWEHVHGKAKQPIEGQMNVTLVLDL